MMNLRKTMLYGGLVAVLSLSACQSEQDKEVRRKVIALIEYKQKEEAGMSNIPNDSYTIRMYKGLQREVRILNRSKAFSVRYKNWRGNAEVLIYENGKEAFLIDGKKVGDEDLKTEMRDISHNLLDRTFDSYKGEN